LSQLPESVAERVDENFWTTIQSTALPGSTIGDCWYAGIAINRRRIASNDEKQL
jgi:hypothetical protein